MLSTLFKSRAVRSLGLAVPGSIVLDAETLEPVAELRAGGKRGDLVAAADGVWISTYEDRTITLIDPDGRERLQVELPDRPTAIALDGDRPLVLCRSGRLLRVDPLEGRIADDVRLPETVSSVAAGHGQVWAVAADADRSGFHVRLLQLDPATLALAREIDLGCSTYFGNLCIGEGTVNLLHEESPRSMGYATFDVVTGAPAPTPHETTRGRGIGERDGLRWTRDGREIKQTEIASGREVGSRRVAAPRTGSCLLAHGRIWVATYSAAGQPDNQAF
jgi:hypothetical protein